MLGLVDQHCCRPPEGKRPLNSVMVLCPHRSGARHESHGRVPDSDRRRWVNLVVDERFFHLKQETSEVVAPTEAARLRRDALHADDWETAAIGFEHRKQFGYEELF